MIEDASDNKKGAQRDESKLLLSLPEENGTFNGRRRRVEHEPPVYSQNSRSLVLIYKMSPFIFPHDWLEDGMKSSSADARLNWTKTTSTQTWPLTIYSRRCFRQVTDERQPPVPADKYHTALPGFMRPGLGSRKHHEAAGNGLWDVENHECFMRGRRWEEMKFKSKGHSTLESSRLSTGMFSRGSSCSMMDGTEPVWRRLFLK